MKILEVCPYSAGGCGVWARAREEAIRLASLGHEVVVFSSNSVKGTSELASKEEVMSGIKIKRFKFKKLGGESYMKFDFEKEACIFSPEVIIVHNYRHLHTTKALNIAKKIRNQGKKCRVFLVTHAPFVEGNITRSKLSALLVRLYDSTFGKVTLNKFEKILAISKWEIPYLLKIGAKKENIIYIPNGIPNEFFTQKKSKVENKVLFLGRIAPKKKIETLIESIPFINDKKTKFEIVGPKEKNYFAKLKKIVHKLKLNNRVKFTPAIYNLEEKIRKIDSAKIFVLPSRVEGMPQSLIEAMARGKVVIGSDSIAIRDLIFNKENGYLFKFNDHISLSQKINFALENKNVQLNKNAIKLAKEFNWDTVIQKINQVITKND